MMDEHFQPNGLPVLIGSLPLGDHQEAARLVFSHTPQIPVWAQLPIYAEEGMVAQFTPGLPGLTVEETHSFMNTSGDAFSDELLAFYEEYMAVREGKTDINQSRFILKPDVARGFFVFQEHLKTLPKPPAAMKGQVTGPITFATAVKDQNGRSIFYDEQARDAAVKLLALKAQWQVRQLSVHKRPVIIFIDEPALAGFGSSEFISISKEEVTAALTEVIDAIHEAGGLAGIHVCANTEWDMIMETAVDLVNFDAFSYFDRFILYPDIIRQFIESGRLIAWGIVPTGNIEDIEAETEDSLIALWEDQLNQMTALGLDRETVLAQSLISPSCGAGSLSLDHANRVLALTKGVSARIRERIREQL